MTPPRIATRGSQLARWQAEHVRGLLQAADAALRVELVIVTTRGDRVLDQALDPIPGKGLFTKEVEEALLDGRADLAVHSLKDLPTEETPGLEIAAILPREDAADALVARAARRLKDLPRGAKVMTGSVRRSSQILHLRPDVEVLPVRGNVPTRLRRFEESGADGIVLACAGLVRLGLDGRIAERLDPRRFLPACGQGALAVQVRPDGGAAERLVRSLDDLSTRVCVTAERAFLTAIGGGCQAPAGAYATVDGGILSLTGMLASPDGRRRVVKSADAELPGDWKADRAASIAAACELGRRGGELVKASGAGGAS